MQKFLVISILVIIGIILYQDNDNFETQARPKKNDEPFICSTYDEIVKIEKCQKKMICEVTLKSGRIIKYQSPALSELVPCNI